MDDSNNLCILCEKLLKPEHDGLEIMGKYICRSCEKGVVDLELKDKNYELVKEKFKKLLA